MNPPKTIFFGIIAAVLVTGILVGGSSQQSTAATDITIPDWVKNNAAWWSSGEIADADYASGIEYMIEAGIIKVASAQGLTDGEPFDELWDAINQLQTDFTNLQISDGIPGTPGEQGPQGEQGEQGTPGSDGSTDLSALQAQIDELETQFESSQNLSIEVRRVQTTILVPVGPGTTLLQTPECAADEFVHSFGYSQNIGGQSLGTNAQPPDTVILTPTKLAVRVGNTLDEPYNLNLDLWCGKIVQP